MSPQTESAFEFGPFRLFPAKQVLMEGTIARPLGSRAIEILICLLERAGQMVSKQQLLERVWPGTFVHEANLRVNVAALRKALGEGQAGRRYIVNLTGQGYSFVAPVRRLEAAVPQLMPRTDIKVRHNLPVQMGRMLGRQADLEAIALQLPMRRCVTVAGPGGIGKTTVAIAVAERLLSVYDDGVWFIDLSAITDGARILPTIAQLLGLSLHAADALPSLLAHLQHKKLLLVLDNCEHVIDAAAKLAESVLLETRAVGILATSREVLRSNGEWVYRLAPLALPPAAGPLSVAEALSFAAVQFFVECASAVLEGFALTEADVPLVVAICSCLDGLPLAIELVAARIDIFGLTGLASVLKDPFLLLSEGRRGAFPRQQSLLRTLEWSYRLLSADEQTILRRLSVLRGGFTLDAALAVAGGDGIGPEQIYSGVLTLSAKSLITSDISSGTQHQHCLLHVTRTLVREKLEQTAEITTVLRRHAEFFCTLLGEAERNWETMVRQAWIDLYARAIGDVGAAIDWAFSPQGDASLGVVLTARALPLGFQVSQVEEFRGRVERALLHSQRIRPPRLLEEMRLNIAFGNLTHNTKGPLGGRTAAIERAIELGRRLESPAYLAEALIGQAHAHFGAGDYLPAIDVATEGRSIAEAAGVTVAVVIAERILAQARHFNGEHAAAARFAQQVIAYPSARLPLAYNPSPIDRRVSMQIILARIFWIQGQWDRADQLIRETLAFAAEDGAFSVCPTLVFGAIPLAIWNGEDEEARALTTTLAQEAKRYTLDYWVKWANCFETALRVRGGDPDCVRAPSNSSQLEALATFSPALLTPDAAARERSGASGWCSPEIRRAQGEWLLDQRAPGSVVDAEALFREALEIARHQGACSWELRAATSLARLWKGDGRIQLAQALLAELLSRSTPPQRTRSADLKAANTLLDSLNGDTPAVKLSRESPARGRRSHRTGQWRSGL